MAEVLSFGQLRDGRPVQQFTLQNKNGLGVQCINYGCRLTGLLVPGPEGPVNMVLGFDDIAGYEADGSSQGAFVGRYANRIEGAAFSIGGKEYALPQNDGDNFLHGCFSHRLFEAEVIGDNSLSFTYISPDGEEGFPGELWVGVIYTITDQNELVMDYRAVSKADTYVNLTNHSYFNLTGDSSLSIHDHLLWLNSTHFLEQKPNLCPTGRMPAVEGGAFDFTQEKAIGRDIASKDPQIQLAGGYDHCFILDKNRPRAFAMAASVREPASGRELKVYTTQPAVQLYTGNFLNGAPGRGGTPMAHQGAFCLETQHYPASPSHPDFPDTLLPAGVKYHEITVLQMSWPE